MPERDRGVWTPTPGPASCRRSPVSPENQHFPAQHWAGDPRKPGSPALPTLVLLTTSSTGGLCGQEHPHPAAHTPAGRLGPHPPGSAASPLWDLAHCHLGPSRGCLAHLGGSQTVKHGRWDQACGRLWAPLAPRHAAMTKQPGLGHPSHTPRDPGTLVRVEPSTQARPAPST